MELKGIASCAGTFKGPAVVVTDVKTPIDILPGSVLVVPFTTPVLAPAIAKAAALVTDIGGRTIHAGVIARELGIPCVTNTKRGTQDIKTGDVIIVDGTSGVVRGA